MVTTTEIIVTGTIWILAAVGGAFSVRGFLRRKREQRAVCSGKNEADTGKAENR